MTAAVATFGTIPQSCAVCTLPEAADRRVEWGCDGRAPENRSWRLSVDCPRCRGRQHDCERCGGSGVEDVDRCPRAIRTPEIEAVLEHVGLIECGILPVAGGWTDQSATFLEALRIVLEAKAKIELQKIEQDREEQRRVTGHGG